MIGAQGQLTEVYEMIDGGEPTYRVIHINTYLAKVTGVNAEVKDSKGHLKSSRSINMTVYCRTGNVDYNAGTVGDKKDYGYLTSASFTTEDFAKGDWLLVQGVVDTTKATQITVVNAEAAESKTVKVTSIARLDKKNTVGLDGEDYKVACKFGYDSDFATTDVGTKKVVFFDTYGNIIGKTDPALDPANYAVLDKLYLDFENGDSIVKGVLVLTSGDKKDVTVGKISYAENQDKNVVTAKKFFAEIADGQYTWASDWELEWAGSTYYNAYYTRLVDYVENDDGTVDFNIPCRDANAARDITIKNGKKYITAADGITPVLTATADTIYMVQTTAAPNAKYAVYVGYENVPSMKVTNAQYVKNTDGTVALVYAYDPTTPDTYSYVYYAGDGVADKFDGTYYYYNVIVLDENGAVADDAATVKSTKELFKSGKGFYYLTKNTDGSVVKDAEKKSQLTVTLHKTEASSKVYIYAVNCGEAFETKDGYQVPKADHVDCVTTVDMDNVKFYDLTGKSLTVTSLDNQKCNLWLNAAGDVVAVLAIN